MTLIQIGILALVALALGLFVVRPVLMSGARRQDALPSPDAMLALPGAAGTADGLRVLTGEIEDGDLPPLSLVSQGEGGGDAGGRDADPVARLRRLIEERQAESVEILRGWMEAEEEKV